LASSFTLELVTRIFWVLVVSLCYSRALLPDYGFLAYSFMPLILVLLTFGSYVSVPSFINREAIQKLRSWAVPASIVGLTVVTLFHVYGNFVGLFLLVMALTTLQSSIAYSVIRIIVDRNWTIFYLFLHCHILLCCVLALYGVSIACLVHYVLNTIFFLCVIFAKLELQTATARNGYLRGLVATFSLGFLLRNLEKPILLVYDAEYFSFYSIVFIYVSHIVALSNQVINFLYASSFSTKSKYSDKFWRLWSSLINKKNHLLLGLGFCILGLIYSYLAIEDLRNLIVICVVLNLLPFVAFSVFSPIMNRTENALKKKFRVLLFAGSLSLAIVSITLYAGGAPYFYPALFNTLFCLFLIFTVRADDIFE